MEKRNPDLGRMGLPFHFMQKVLSCQCWLQTMVVTCNIMRWNQELCCQVAYVDKDALDHPHRTASFPSTPLHIAGLALNAAYEYLGRKGRKKIRYSHNTPVIRAMPLWAVTSFFPLPEQQQDQDTNNRGQSLSAIIFQPLRPDPLTHKRSAANPSVFT